MCRRLDERGLFQVISQGTKVPIAGVGTGVIGRSWIRVFTRAGHPVQAFAPAPGQREKARTWLEADLERDEAEGLLTAFERTAQIKLVTFSDSLEAALDGVFYVQESGPEQLEGDSPVLEIFVAEAAVDA